MDFSKTSYSQRTKSPPPSNLKFVPQLVMNPLTSDHIEKCLDDNKKLILAILESISLGKFNESAQYQEMLQHNLTYLADMANVQLLQGSSASSQLQEMTNSVQQGNQIHQTTQASTLKMQQESDHLPKLPFMLNTPQSQDQPMHQFLHINHQQQFQSQLGFRYQEMLQNNLAYLPDMANAQLLQGSSTSSQAMTSSVQQGNQIHQTQASTLKMQQESEYVPKLPFMLNPPRAQDQPLHQFFQQQFQSPLGFRSTANTGMHQIMRPELFNSSGMDIQESMQGGSSNGLGKRKRGGGGMN